MASSMPAYELAEFQRLMLEEIKEVAVFYLDPDGIITLWNRAAEEMKGYTAKEAIGQHLRLLYTEEDRARHWPEHNLKESARNGFYREETWRRKKDGSLFWARIALTALHDESGQLVGFSKITVDLTEHKQLERCVKEREEIRQVRDELQQAVQKLKEADARKDDFLAMLAHELRNPLAPIRSAAEILKRANLDEERVRKTSEIIARQVGHMTSLVDDLLDVSRVTRGLVQLERTVQDMRQAVTDAMEQVSPLIRSRRHQLALHLAPERSIVLGDQKRLVQVVANLLNNAAKYTPEGGNIELRTEVRPEHVTLTVTDDGIGMEPELCKQVFELFTQASRSPDRTSGGLGLGLALVKSLVELHGGKVSCASDGVGTGSTFTVELPLVRADGVTVAPPTASEAPRVPQRPLRVMVVDDNADAAEMLAMFLETAGHIVTVTLGAQEALQRARHNPPDVCLLDIGLPEIDGNELARRLKAQPETAHAVLIAVTGYGQEHDRQAAAAAGFSHHLVKPVEPQKLVSLLAEVNPSGRAAQ